MAKYHSIWGLLLLGWVVSYVDRTAAGPIITFMIGDLIGSLFFAGLCQCNFVK